MDPLAALEGLGRRRESDLAETTRIRRGVVHTPPSLARWIARACRGVDGPFTLVDPACGPGIFLAAALEALERPPTRALGIDVDEAAIAVAREALAPRMAAASWRLELRVADALEELPAIEGAAIVVGNPPWTARTASRGLSEALLEDFRRDEHGVALGERKIGVLSDAYVRFVRWGTALVERAPAGGVLAMVVNASFLDGRVHRGMRSYLRRAFDRIDLVDLGGSALIARRTGTRDENVFGVRPGAVVIVGRRERGTHVRDASMRSAALRGARRDKLATLDREAVPLAPFVPTAPLHRFVPTRSEPLPEAWPSIDRWMPFSREGVQTNRDELCVDVDRDTLLDRVRAFVRDPDRALARLHFDPVAAATRLRDVPLEQHLVRFAYRPLDERWLFAHPALCHRPRPELGAALAHAPLALVTAGKDRGERPFAHLGVVTAIADNCWLSARSSCRARLHPLVRPDGAPNVGVELDAAPREVLAWLAAFLAAPTFRARFDESLRAGPIRVPRPRSRGDLEAVGAAGERIIEAFVGDPAGSEGTSTAPLVVGHHTLAASARTVAIARAQRAADEVVRDLIGSGP